MNVLVVEMGGLSKLHHFANLHLWPSCANLWVFFVGIMRDS